MTQSSRYRSMMSVVLNGTRLFSRPEGLCREHVITRLEKKVEQTLCLINSKKRNNDDASRSRCTGCVDQVAAPAHASAPETPKAASTPTPATAEKAVPATGEEAVPAKPKRTRRTAKPATDGEEVTKPKRRTTRTTRAKRTVAADSSAPISDEVAQARALARIRRLRWCAPAVVLPSVRPRL